MEPSITGPLGESGHGSLEVAKGEEGHHALYTAVCIVSATTLLEAGGSHGLHGPPETTEHQTKSGLESVSKPTVPLLHLGAFVDMAELGQPCLLCFVSCLQTRSQMHPLPYHPWPEDSLPASRSAPSPLPTERNRISGGHFHDLYPSQRCLCHEAGIQDI